MSIARTFGRVCRGARLQLDVTQQQLGDAVGVSRGYIATVEAGRANVTIEVIERIGDVLGLSLDLVAAPPVFLRERPRHDLVHARCVGFIHRRLVGKGWLVERELDVSEGRIHGWIDVVAFHPPTSSLVAVEVKTRLQDLGAMQRQVRWYESHVRHGVARFGWRPSRIGLWLICLSSAEVDAVLVAHREAMGADFPHRARHMLHVVGGEDPPMGRGLAMIDPGTHRRDWLLPTRIDGRRTRAAYEDYADAARRLGPGRVGDAARRGSLPPDARTKRPRTSPRRSRAIGHGSPEAHARSFRERA